MPDPVLTGINGALTPSYGINDILNFTQSTTSQPSGFRRVLGAVAGGVGNMFLPGIGGVIGNLIGGGPVSGGQPGSSGLLGSQPSQLLELQRQMNNETTAFEVATNMLKAQHDSIMDIARNLKS